MSLEQAAVDKSRVAGCLKCFNSLGMKESAASKEIYD